MSDQERLDTAAFRQLEALVRSLVDELAGFRKRALAAEAKVKGYESAGGPGATTGARLATLEEENAALRVRLDKAKTGSKAMLERVHFLRQQAQAADK